MKKIVLLILCFSITQLYSQTINTKTSLYFSTDKYELTNKHIKNLKLFLDSIPQNDTNRIVKINKILIIGNTDSDSDSLYNIHLSEKRTLSVTNFLLENGFKTNNIKYEYYGENKPISSNNIPEGKQKNRRVDIYISYSIIKKQTQETLLKEDIKVIKDTCEKDTSITLTYGTIFTINRCEYLKNKDSIIITEYITPESIKNAGLTTLTETNQQLYTAGMWDFKFPKDSCLKKPIIIRVPIDTCLKNYKMSLWYSDKNGRWRNEQSKAVKIVTIGRQKYYEFKISCPGKINLDVLTPNITLVSFKAKNKLKLQEINLVWVCPQSYNVIKETNPQKILKKEIPMGSNEILIDVIAITKKGEILKFSNKKLSSLKHKRFLFERYVIYKKDFKNN